MGSFVQSMGSSIVGVVCLSSIRNLTPPDKTGRFQGVRMVFVVMLPMVVGSIVSGAVSSSNRYIAGVDEFGNATYTCPPVMFLLAAIIVLLAILPTIFLLKAKAEDLVTPAEGLLETANGATIAAEGETAIATDETAIGEAAADTESAITEDTFAQTAETASASDDESAQATEDTSTDDTDK